SETPTYCCRSVQLIEPASGADSPSLGGRAGHQARGEKTALGLRRNSVSRIYSLPLPTTEGILFPQGRYGQGPRHFISSNELNPCEGRRIRCGPWASNGNCEQNQMLWKSTGDLQLITVFSGSRCCRCTRSQDWEPSTPFVPPSIPTSHFWCQER